MFISSFSKEAKYIRLGCLPTNTSLESDCKQEFNISEKIIHPDYHSPSIYNDIALIRIDGKPNLSFNVRPACLHTNSSYVEGVMISATWKRNSTNQSFSKIFLNQSSYSRCNHTYSDSIGRRLRYGILEESQICAVAMFDGSDTCKVKWILL